MSSLGNPFAREDSSRDEDVVEINPADIRVSAMNLLARREHSRGELLQKLKKRYPNAALVESELQRLADDNLQSDARFAESFVRQRASRGYGVNRVRQEMREKGLSDAEICVAIEQVEIDWFALALEVYHKKFGDSVAMELREKAKRTRFMQYRGFEREYYQHLLNG
ncbi:MAG: regulatory protein RecX [Halioglobus sp.]